MTPQSPTTDLEEATALHGAGRLTEASALYQRILAARPDSIEALHGLGLITLDLGQADRALPLLTRCAAAAPKNGMYRASLGLALLRQGKTEQAAAYLLEAANLSPRDLEPRLYLARALGVLGRWTQALDVLSASAALFAGRAEVWAAKGNTERVLLRHAAAESSLRKALALAPRDPDVLNNLGVVVRAQGRTEEAIGYYGEALARAPDRALIHANMGNALTHLDRGALAETHLRRAVELEPAMIEARSNLAAYLTKSERPAEAVPHYRAVLATEPKNVDAWTNLGVTLLDTGEIAEAEQCYRRAIALRPDNAEARYNLAWLLLLTGQWREGWREYEWRWKLHHFSSRKRTFPQPLWEGDTLSGTVLLHAEQGLGDAIQFVRYAALVKTCCARVVIECPRPLVALFQSMAVSDLVIAAGDALPAFDAHAPFMSLPRIFATTPETVPPPARPRSPEVIADRLRLPSTGKRRIGLVWAGSADNKIDRRRTVAAKLLAPLVSGTDADVVSLQVGPRAGEISDLPADRIIFSCEGRVTDFADTAAVISQLDLIVGVDTVVMHLAGTLGKPTWMLVPFSPDYRWLLGRDNTPWYASIRLFRQEKSGDWQGVLARVAAALTNWQP
jgi:tetratricopeptide (TPR) repeat protein